MVGSFSQDYRLILVFVHQEVSSLTLAVLGLILVVVVLAFRKIGRLTYVHRHHHPKPGSL